MLKSFDTLMESVIGDRKVARCVLAGATDRHALEAIFDAEERGFIYPVLVGVEADVKKALQEMDLTSRRYDLVDCPKDFNPSQKAVELIRAGRGDFILKGKLETRDLLKPILDKEKGLNSSGFVTHFGLMQLKSYHKLLAMSDSAVIPYPSLEDKINIVKAAAKTFKKLGVEKPVVGALCAVEVVNPKMKETLDAAELKKLSIDGKLDGAIVEGPISFDLATQKESALIKGYNSEYAGDVDMLLVPQMVSGNIMSKIWNVDEENTLAGCLVGADIPIALTSRSASSREKLYSLLLCTALI